jgi:malonyl-CoA O-methyltransferase
MSPRIGPDAMFDQRQVRRAFSRAAAGYDEAATLQRAVEARLIEALEYYPAKHGDARPPQRVLDLGSGPGRGAAAMRKRWPKAQVLALDLALPMLRQARVREGWHPLRRGIDRVCADARALPLAGDSVDVLFSNLCLQWVEDLPAVLAGFRRVLRPGGMLLVSTFGHDTLHELRAAFAAADAAPHVSPFVEIAQLGDAPGLPATWEIVTALAWAPDAGAPIRDAGGEIASFPANNIPIRRRQK